MNNVWNKKHTLALAMVGVLAGCGGGGGSSSGGAAPTALNLNAAYSAMITGGNSVLYTLTGDCSGFLSQTFFPAYDTTNWASPAVAVLAVENMDLNTLDSASQAKSVCTQVLTGDNGKVRRNFYDPTTKLIVNEGHTTGTFWNVYADQTPLPTSVTVGSSGTLYTWKDYGGAASTSVTPKETGAVTYSVIADTGSTLKVIIAETATNVATGRQAWRVATTYRLNADNTLTALSVEMRATADSNLKQALSIDGIATPSITLNAQSIIAASLNAGSNEHFNVYDDDENVCTPVANIATSALVSSAGTTSRGVAYQKSNSSTFAPSSGYSGSNACLAFSLPQAENSYFDANYSLLQKTTTNPNDISTSVMNSNVALPTNVTINSSGTLYSFNRYMNSETTAFATGTATYYVGALTPTTLVYFDIETKNDKDISRRTARQIFARSASQNNQVAPLVWGYVRDGYTYYFQPVVNNR